MTITSCFVSSGSRGLHNGLWCGTGRARSWWSLPAYLHRSARLGATQASRVPGVPLGDHHWAAGEKQPQCEWPYWETKTHSFWCFHFSLCCLNTSDFHLFPDHLRSPAGWGPGDGYHRSSMSVQHTEPAGRPGSSSGSPASDPGSTQPQEQQRAQELHPPPPCAIRQWGEERNVSIVQSLPFYLLHICDRNKGVKFKFKFYIYRQESEKNCWKASWELSNPAIFVLSRWVCFISASWHTN